MSAEDGSVPPGQVCEECEYSVIDCQCCRHCEDCCDGDECDCCGSVEYRHN